MRQKKIKLNINKDKWKESYKDYEKTILLFITNQCNLNCDYCFDSPNLSNKPEMSIDYIKRIVEANPEINKYDLQGGEPLLHSKINEIIRYLNNKNKKVGLYTNGYLLNKLDIGHKSIKICVSFQVLESNNKSNKSLFGIKENILFYQKYYPFKLVFLMNKKNQYLLEDVVDYVEKKFKFISKLTIGLIRDEADYWNDKKDCILSFKEYADRIQHLLDNYKGNLNFDVFTKGVLYTKNLPAQRKNQICRFKNVFVDGFVPCLYLIASDKKIKLNDDLKVPYDINYKCKRTGGKNCLADKIYLINNKNVK